MTILNHYLPFPAMISLLVNYLSNYCCKSLEQRSQIKIMIHTGHTDETFNGR